MNFKTLQHIDDLIPQSMCPSHTESTFQNVGDERQIVLPPLTRFLCFEGLKKLWNNFDVVKSKLCLKFKSLKFRDFFFTNSQTPLSGTSFGELHDVKLQNFISNFIKIFENKSRKKLNKNSVEIKTVILNEKINFRANPADLQWMCLPYCNSECWILSYLSKKVTFFNK